MKGIKDFFDRLDVKKRGYKVNLWITRGAFLFLCLLMVVVAYVDGVDGIRGFWVECPVDADSLCSNPFYDPSCEVFKDWDDQTACERKFLMQGEIIGEKPSFLARNFSFIAVVVVLGALLLNHLMYNRNFKVKKNDF